MFSTKSLIIKSIQSLAIVCAVWLFGFVPAPVSALEDVVAPGIVAIERVEVSDGTTPSQGTYGVGPVHYKVQFSEPVQLVTQGSFYVLVRSGCSTVCASVSSVDTYPIAGQVSSDAYVVALDNFVDSGTVSIKPKPNSGIIDLVGNALDATSADLAVQCTEPSSRLCYRY
jgi:hypothetical protein